MLHKKNKVDVNIQPRSRIETILRNESLRKYSEKNLPKNQDVETFMYEVISDPNGSCLNPDSTKLSKKMKKLKRAIEDFFYEIDTPEEYEDWIDVSKFHFDELRSYLASKHPEISVFNCILSFEIKKFSEEAYERIEYGDDEEGEWYE